MCLGAARRARSTHLAHFLDRVLRCLGNLVHSQVEILDLFALLKLPLAILEGVANEPRDDLHERYFIVDITLISPGAKLGTDRVFDLKRERERVAYPFDKNQHDDLYRFASFRLRVGEVLHGRGDFIQQGTR